MDSTFYPWTTISTYEAEHIALQSNLQIENMRKPNPTVVVIPSATTSDIAEYELLAL